MKAFFLAMLMLLFKKMALLSSLLTFFSTATAAEFVEITRTRPDHLPCQPTPAAELLLDGCKIEPYTIIIMGLPSKLFLKVVHNSLMRKAIAMKKERLRDLDNNVPRAA
jgi:hypothetical protein